MARRFPRGQKTDATYAWVTWLGGFDKGFASVKPVARPSGLLGDVPCDTPDYRIALPALGVGRHTTGADGNSWKTTDPKVQFVAGLAYKQGLEGMRFRERDLFSSVVNAKTMSMMDYGRSEKLYEDGRVADAIEKGFDLEEQTDEGTRNMRCFDGLPVWAKNHPNDPVAPKVGEIYSTVFDYPLTPDGILAVRDKFADRRDAIGNPIFGNMVLEFALVYPAALRSDAEKCLDRKFVAEFAATGGAAVDNVAYKLAKGIQLTNLKDSKRWYLFVINFGLKPVIRVGLQPLKRITRGPESELYKDKQIMKFFSYERADYRPSDPRLGATSKKS